MRLENNSHRHSVSHITSLSKTQDCRLVTYVQPILGDRPIHWWPIQTILSGPHHLSMISTTSNISEISCPKRAIAGCQWSAWGPRRNEIVVWPREGLRTGFPGDMIPPFRMRLQDLHDSRIYTTRTSTVI